MDELDHTPTCPVCGRPKAKVAWSDEVCPHCLLELALVESSDEELEIEDTPTAGPGDRSIQGLSHGQILGNRYGVRRLLGRGGMGEVWRAFDLKLRVDVALKTVRRELAAQERLLETLRQEVRAAREVVSPNVCRVYDLQELEGHELVSMEYVDGTTLFEVLRERGPLELAEAREIASQFLAGLDAIHRAGLVHRDIKPENLMITRTGRVVVMDFGIAKGLAAGSTGTVAGTPAYMAPEQSRGEAVDARADVFSAGIVLAEMLTPGIAGGRAARESLWLSIRQEPPELPDSPWRAVIEQAVAQRRELRFEAASALARALEEVTIRVAGAEDVLPYPGLMAFSEQDREYFFGRELEVEALWKKIRRLSMLAVVGPSGTGKTSFLKAGLLASAPDGWAHVLCTPGPAPLTALRQALVPHLSDDREAMRELVKLEDPEAMVSAVSRWRGRSRHALLVVDQLEELFTLNPAEVQAQFAGLLGRLALDSDVRVLLSLRDDFLIHCNPHEALKPIFTELTVLGPPAGAALRRAVVQPALKCGYRFEDEALVDEMLAEVEGERGALPMLAFSAEQLWQRRDRDQGLLTREAYELIGGVAGALAQHAELTLERIGADRLAMVREIFRNLVTAQGTRAVQDRDELLSVFGRPDRDAAARVLDALIDARLLTSYGVEAEGDGKEGEAGQRVEVVHESLLTAWPRLVRWQAQDVEGARMRDDLRQAARRWQERNRSDDLLWVGSAYREYQVWRERYPGRLSEIEQAFARAMAAKARRKRRLVRAATTAVVLISTGVAIAIGVSRHQVALERDRAEAGKLVALGRTLFEHDATAALAYARASLGLHDTPEARRFAVEVLWRGPVARILPLQRMVRELGLPADPSAIGELRVSPDGRWLATKGWDNRRVLLFPRDGGPARALPRQPDGDASLLQFGPQGDVLVTGGSGASLRFWSLPELEEIRSAELGGLRTGGCVRDGRLLTWTRIQERGEMLLRAWSVPGEDPEVLGVFAPPGLPNEFAPSGTAIAYTRSRTVLVRPLPPGDQSAERVVGQAGDEVPDIAFAPAGDRLASLDRSGEIRIWSTVEGAGEPLRVLQGPPYQGMARLLFGPKGRFLTQPGPNHTFYLWDLDGPPDGQPVVVGRPNPSVLILTAFDPGGQWLVTCDSHETVEFWPLRMPWVRVLRGSGANNWFTAFTNDSRWLATCAMDYPARLWPLSAADGRARDIASGDTCFSLAMDPTQDRLLLGTRDSKVLLVPTARGSAGRLLGTVPALPGPVAFDRAGGRAFVGPQGPVAAADPELRRFWMWDLTSGEEQHYSVAHLTGPDWRGFDDSTTFAPDGSLFMAGQGGIRRLVVPDEAGAAVSSETVCEATWARSSVSRDGQLLLVLRTDKEGGGPLSGGFEELLLFDRLARTSRRITTHGAHLSVTTFGPSGRVIVTGDQDGTVRVGLATGEEPHLLVGHAGPVQSLAVSPDGRWVASASDDSIRLWPMPEVSKPPLHTLPLGELLARLDSFTNLRVVRDPEASTGWTTELGPFSGWEEMPEW